MQTAFERLEISSYSYLISGAVTHTITTLSILSNSFRLSWVLSKLLSDSLVLFRVLFVFFWNALDSLEFTWMVPDSLAFSQNILDFLVSFRILQVFLGFS